MYKEKFVIESMQLPNQFWSIEVNDWVVFEKATIINSHDGLYDFMHDTKNLAPFRVCTIFVK